MTEADDRRELREAIRQLHTSIEALRSELVRKDVYASDKITVANQFAALDRSVNDLDRRVEKDIDDLEKKVDKDIDDRKADRRLIIAAFLALAAQLIVMVYQQAQGAS